MAYWGAEICTYLLKTMATYKIKLEDKAAFLNRMEKQESAIGSGQIKDNKLKGYFEVTVESPEQLEIVKAILKQSPKINTIKEMKQRLTRTQLQEMVRQELHSVLTEKKEMDAKKKKKEKEKLDEAAIDYAWIPAAAAGLGIAGNILKSVVSIMKEKGYKGFEGFMKAWNEFKGSQGDVAKKF